MTNDENTKSNRYYDSNRWILKQSLQCYPKRSFSISFKMASKMTILQLRRFLSSNFSCLGSGVSQPFIISTTSIWKMMAPVLWKLFPLQWIRKWIHEKTGSMQVRTWAMMFHQPRKPFLLSSLLWSAIVDFCWPNWESEKFDFTGQQEISSIFCPLLIKCSCTWPSPTFMDDQHVGRTMNAHLLKTSHESDSADCRSCQCKWMTKKSHEMHVKNVFHHANNQWRWLITLFATFGIKKCHVSWHSLNVASVKTFLSKQHWKQSEHKEAKWHSSCMELSNKHPVTVWTQNQLDDLEKLLSVLQKLPKDVAHTPNVGEQKVEMQGQRGLLKQGRNNSEPMLFIQLRTQAVSSTMDKDCNNKNLVRFLDCARQRRKVESSVMCVAFATLFAAQAQQRMADWQMKRLTRQIITTKPHEKLFWNHCEQLRHHFSKHQNPMSFDSHFCIEPAQHPPWSQIGMLCIMLMTLLLFSQTEWAWSRQQNKRQNSFHGLDLWREMANESKSTNTSSNTKGTEFFFTQCWQKLMLQTPVSLSNDCFFVSCLDSVWKCLWWGAPNSTASSGFVWFGMQKLESCSQQQTTKRLWSMPPLPALSFQMVKKMMFGATSRTSSSKISTFGLHFWKAWTTVAAWNKQLNWGVGWSKMLCQKIWKSEHMERTTFSKHRPWIFDEAKSNNMTTMSRLAKPFWTIQIWFRSANECWQRQRDICTQRSLAWSKLNEGWKQVWTKHHWLLHCSILMKQSHKKLMNSSVVLQNFQHFHRGVVDLFATSEILNHFMLQKLITLSQFSFFWFFQLFLLKGFKNTSMWDVHHAQISNEPKLSHPGGSNTLHSMFALFQRWIQQLAFIFHTFKERCPASHPLLHDVIAFFHLQWTHWVSTLTQHHIKLCLAMNDMLVLQPQSSRTRVTNDHEAQFGKKMKLDWGVHNICTLTFGRLQHQKETQRQEKNGSTLWNALLHELFLFVCKGQFLS